MELLRIGKEKLKIILTHEDLRSFEMDEDDLDYANTETKRMLWDILHQAKSSVGFNADGHRVLVQLYPSRHGGCEMFVTRLGALPSDCQSALGEDREDSKENEESEESEETEDTDAPLNAYCEADCPQKRQKKERLSAFYFESLSDLLAACRRLSERGHHGRSFAYRAEDGRYHLFLGGLDPSPYCSLDEFSFLFEYGASEDASLSEALLSERGLLFCPSDAVARLSVL